MKSQPALVNLILAWIWILGGFLSGFALGLNFHREDWLGGYTSLKRRLYRLAHISFFGLATVNLLFFFTARIFVDYGPTARVASCSFIIGAVTMPLCCLIQANSPRLRGFFLIPVASLITGGVLTLWELSRL